MAQHKVTKKAKTSIPPGAKKTHKKKKATPTAHKGTDAMKLSRNRGKADRQKVDQAISRMINRKNEEAVRGRAASDFRSTASK